MKIIYDSDLEAFNFRRATMLGDNDPIDCKSLLIRLNVIASYQPLSPNFSGMSVKAEGYKFMLINSTHSVGRQHFTVAHELYHLFIQSEFKPHVCNPGLINDYEERRADMFASSFLMPEMGIKSLIPSDELSKKKLSSPTLIKLEQVFGVSHKSMTIRLFELGLIDHTQKEMLDTFKVKDVATLLGFNSSLYSSGNNKKIIGDYGLKTKIIYDKQVISEGYYIELMSAIGLDVTALNNE